ncbi:TPR repeat [alpha proteobacterium U9-1i]|nr:TPR repeat [alpha proteobacterium U9-1i]
MKSYDVSALANAAHELLRQGDAVGAERVLSPVFDQLKAEASVMHLMGLIKKAQNKLVEAEKHLRGAISHALSEGSYYNDLGVVLQARGEFEEAARVFRAAIALLPDAGAVRVNLTRCLVASGQLKEADHEARTYISVAPGAESWTLLHQVQRAQERHRDALVSAETALRYAPKLRSLRINYAASLDRLGRGKEALPIYSELVRENVESPDLALAFARALYAEGEKQDAETVLEQASSAWPEAANLHGALARMRWLRGEGERAGALIEQAIAKRPSDLGLRLLCADVHHRGGHDARALTILDEALRAAPDQPALLAARGIVLDELNQLDEAVRTFERALLVQPGAASTQRNLVSTLLRAGRPQEALGLARTIRQQAPDDQLLIACVASALRMLGDPAYGRFNDYARYVRSYDIPAPRGFFTADNFNASLAEILRVQHRVNAHPLDQSLTHGTQTGRSLLASEEPNLLAFFKAVEAAIRDYVAALPLGLDDPVGRRKSDRQLMTSCWSVRLTQGGAQPNHVHDQGWLSSAYYVALNPAKGAKGRLKFGEPHRPMPGCSPDHFVEPKVGTLVLFPSYMWHGTEAFGGAERLSLAFDVVPA